MISCYGFCIWQYIDCKHFNVIDSILHYFKEDRKYFSHKHGVIFELVTYEHLNGFLYFATRDATKLTLILKLLFQNSIITSGNTDSWSCIVVHPGIQVKNVLTCMENRMRICGKKNHFQRTILLRRRLYIYTTILILVHPVQLIRYVHFISPRQ